jgi:NADH-quinone oxidoreductase subunit J
MNITITIAGIIAISSAIMTVTRSNAVHALLYLVISFFSIAVVFFSMEAPFVAALEIIVYAGAIMVLFVFVIMLLNIGSDRNNSVKPRLSFRTWITPLIMAVILLIELIILASTRMHIESEIRQTTPKEVGVSLFSDYVVGVELASLLLLAGLTGAFYLASRTGHSEEELKKN